MARQLIEQQRAVAASDAVLDFVKRNQDDKGRKEFRQELQQLPARILASGLGQTLAFYASKGKMHDQVGSYLARFLAKKTTTQEFLDEIVKGPASDYRHRTREALAYAEWLKRYSKALIQTGD
jgi:CRISPR type III-B/RAMP module-associated protein Cmr5